MKANIKKKLSNYPQLYAFLKKIYFLVDDIKRYVRNIISIPLMLFPIHKNKIVICSYFGKGYGDNGKYIVEEIIRRELDYDIVWLLKKELIGKVEFPTNVRVVKYGSLIGLYELATAKIWIDNSRKYFYSLKRKNQYYIQTWHGGIALKKIEKDITEALSKNYINIAKRDSRMANLFISNSEFCSRMYSNAFWYKNEILEIGSPRCDILFKYNNKIINKVKNYYNINEKNKILLYAPTFRKDKNIDIYNVDFSKLLKILKHKFPNDWTIIVRLHPNISQMSNYMDYSEDIINASDYDDMYELLSTADILITDYSSSMFEFSFSKKPVFLFATDIDNYKKDRNFYFNIFDLPYPVCQSNDELFYKIENFDRNEYLTKLEGFLNKLKIYEDGEASFRLVKRINKVINS